MTSQHPTDAPVSQGDLVSIAPPVCERLLGEPSSRSSREWRWGRKGSFRLKLDTGTWSDFEAEEGGGVLALVMREQRLDKAGALETWPETPIVPKVGLLTSIIDVAMGSCNVCNTLPCRIRL